MVWGCGRGYENFLKTHRVLIPQSLPLPLFRRGRGSLKNKTREGSARFFGPPRKLMSSFFKDLLDLSDLGESFQKKRTPTPGRTVRRCGGGGLQINLGREASASLPSIYLT